MSDLLLHTEVPCMYLGYVCIRQSWPVTSWLLRSRPTAAKWGRGLRGPGPARDIVLRRSLVHMYQHIPDLLSYNSKEDMIGYTLVCANAHFPN